MTQTEIFYSYWYHSESDSHITLPTNEIEHFCNTADGGLCKQITVEEYMANVKSPKQLPEGVRGILKNAKWWEHAVNKDVIIGDLWYDPKEQIPNGCTINTSRIQDIRSDGIYRTSHSLYFVQWAPGEQFKGNKK